MSKDYAKIWQEQAEKAQKQEEAETAEINLDGFEFIGRRLPLQEWVRAGRVPQGLTAQFIRIQRGEQTDIKESDLTSDEVIEAMKFQPDAICYCVVKPKIVRHSLPLQAGEVRYSEVFSKTPELIDKIMTWVFQGCPGVPVKTKNGVTTVEAVENFREGITGEASAGNRHHRRALRKTTKRPVATV